MVQSKAKSSKTVNNAAAENSIYLDDSLVEHCHKLRLYKSLAEQRLMRQSCQIASKAFIKAMMSTKPGSTEHELYATLDYECRMGGAEYLAYPPVVATGNNANTLHYIDNKQKIKDGDLILVDAGCEYHGYSSDISRTWPASGWFSDAQKTLYEATLCVQKELIDMCQERPSLDTLYEAMCFKLGKALAAAHVFKKNVDPSELNMLARALCPHHVSHYLGMDVHDIGTVKKSIKTEPGFIITVEPGVYVSKNNIRVHEEFLGLGIRIEDDVLITENSIEVLSEDCPKEIEDIEKIIPFLFFSFYYLFNENYDEFLKQNMNILVIQFYKNVFVSKVVKKYYLARYYTNRKMNIGLKEKTSKNLIWYLKFTLLNDLMRFIAKHNKYHSGTYFKFEKSSVVYYVNSFLDAGIPFYIYTNTHILFWTRLPEMPITIYSKLDTQHNH
ncbi:hypothetical protein AGLY_010686 [Aphis glycines]|uniref:Peptidase M24 domain-containing protein n=1 Tax=Aphis glycines TaxID=307491 RepID=A0A6G0TFK7_APHGL|nr:hypothetical protein AGLY_010686 [Aphis glycines]